MKINALIASCHTVEPLCKHTSEIIFNQNTLLWVQAIHNIAPEVRTSPIIYPKGLHNRQRFHRNANATVTR